LSCGGKTRTAAKIWLALAELLPDEGTTPAVPAAVLDADGLTHQFHSPLIRLEQGQDDRVEADWATVMGYGDGAIGCYVENDEGMRG